MSKPAFTPGPWIVQFGEKWPYCIKTVNSKGVLVASVKIPCYSSSDKSFDDSLNCANMLGDGSVVHYRDMNHQVLSNEYLRAAAPELFEALQGLLDIIDAAGLISLSSGVQLGATSWYVKASDRVTYARAALLKATGVTP